MQIKTWTSEYVVIHTKNIHTQCIDRYLVLNVTSQECSLSTVLRGKKKQVLYYTIYIMVYITQDSIIPPSFTTMDHAMIAESRRTCAKLSPSSARRARARTRSGRREGLVCTLPRGVNLESRFEFLPDACSTSFCNSLCALAACHTCYDYTDKWNVLYQCECALVSARSTFSCSMRFEGDMWHTGSRLDKEFVKAPMT